MRLIVFGASGGCGSHLVRIASARGHTVSAVVRAETHFEGPAATVLRGDVLDASFVQPAIRDHDVVASCLGIRYRHPWAKRKSPDDFTSHATANIVNAMTQAGIQRISVISAAGVGDSRPGLNLPMRIMLTISNVGVAYADLERAEKTVRESALDWQAVRPTTLSNRPGSNSIRILPAYPVTASIAREDVATFMLNELEASRFSLRTPLISN